MNRLSSFVAVLLLGLLIAGCSGGSDPNGEPSTGRYLVSITVLPVDPGLPAGRTQQFIAIGNYSDGFQFDLTRLVTWSSSDPTVASVDPAAGLVTTVATGQAVISARLAVTGSTTLTVTGATLSRLIIIPADASEPAGTQRQFTALGAFSDGSTADVTSLATWSSSNPVVLDVVPSGPDAGLADFLIQGAVTLTASYLGTNAAVPVTVTPATLIELLVDPVVATVPAGLTVQYQATGIYSDGTSSPLTDEVVWSSSDSAIATIDGFGLARGLVPGIATIRADATGLSSSATLTVSAPTTVGLEILPPAVDAPAGTQGQLRLVAFKSDGSVVEATAEATWRSSNITVAIIIPDGSNAGFGYLLAPGTATVTASFDGLEASIPVTVTAAVLVEILLQPVDASIASGLDLQYLATGIYSDGSSEPLGDEVSWQSSDPAVATIDLAGLAHGLAPGTTTITATFSGVSGSTSLTVTAPILTALQILPASIDVPAVTIGQLQALAFYSDGSTGDATAEATWNSTDEAVLFVVPAGADAGFASALSPGSATVSATFQGVSDSIPATVRPAVLTGIVVEPVVASVASGLTVQYTATGLYSDGSSEPLGDEVGWQTSDPAVAVIDLDGLAQGVQPGVAIITGSYGGFSDQATLTVTAAVVTRLQALPPTVTAPLGSTGQLRAAALYSDGTIAEVTAESTWNSSDEGIVYVVADGGEAGRAAATGVGAATVSASFSGQSSAMPVTVTAAVLTEILVQPVEVILAKGLDQQFVATGVYSDGTSEPLGQEVAWQSSDPAIATVNTAGLANAVDIGVATISASFGGLVGQATLTITAATVTSVQVAPAVVDVPVGTRGQLTATAYYTDLTTGDVTKLAIWTSSAPATVDVVPNGSEAGFATALAEGGATLTATFAGVTGTAQVTVTPAVLLELVVTPASEIIASGLTVQYSATGIFSDGSSSDLTDDVGWQSSNPVVAVIDVDGLARGVSIGTTSIEATLDGVSDQASLQVTAAVITGLQVLPGAIEAPAGSAGQLTSIAFYSNGTSAEVTDDTAWNSSDESVLFVRPASPGAGLAVARTLGSATVTAQFQGAVATIPATVTAAVLQSINISPANATVASGIDVQYQATGIYSDGSSKPLTDQVDWLSSDPAVATINQAGLATTVGAGSTTVTASLSGVVSQTALTVTAAIVNQVQITPAGLVEPAGTSGQLTATAFYTDGSSQDVTTTATWTSSDPAVATVVPTGPDGGFTELLAKGGATVSVIFDGVSDSTPVTVTDAILVAIDIDPANDTVPSGVPVQYDATGLFSDGSASPINDDVSWQSSNPAVAVIDTYGLAQTVTPGGTTISATADGVSSSTSLTVDNAIVVSMQIVPGFLVQPLGTVTQLQAIATFSDLTTKDVTELATWISSNDTIVDVVSGGAKSGQATMVGLGFAFVSANYGGVNTSIQVEVTAAVLTGIKVSPINQSVPRGVQVQYTAFGLYSDGTSVPLDDAVTWRSSDTSVATIDEDGLANTLGSSSLLIIGVTEISASFDEFRNATNLTVTTAAVTGVQITPTGLEEPAGTSGQLTATAFYTDNTSQDVSDVAVWSSSDDSIVKIGATGENGGFTELLAPGVATVSVTFDGFGDADPITVTNAVLVSIDVDPVVDSVPKGSEVQYNATGFFSDGSSSTINDDVSWNSSNTAVATIDLDGQAQAVGLGATDITATLDGITGNAVLDVTDAIVVTLQVTPPGLVEPAGTSSQLQAVAVFSDASDEDVTNEATWTSSDESVVDVVASGASAGFTNLISTGTATVTATYQGIADSIPVEVTDAVLVGIQVDPPNATKAAGLEQQYNATGLFSDGSATPINSDVTWQSGDTAVVTITQDGVATGKVAGTTTISASASGITESVPLTITDAVLIEIQVTPVVDELIAGQVSQYRAEAVFSDNQTDDVTAEATWSTGDTNVANISNAAGDKGRLVALAAGSTTVNAGLDGTVGLARLDVLPVAVVAVEIVPVNISVPQGISSEWVALAVFSDDSTLDITESAVWFSADNGIATVLAGVVTGVSEGDTTIFADYQGVSDDHAVIVTSPDAEAVEIKPTLARLDVGTSERLDAIARFSDGTNAIVTEDASWLVDDPTIAQVDNTPGQKGIATALSPGLAAVTATLSSDAAGGSVIEVVDLTLTSLTVTPASKNTTVGSSGFYTATGTYNDGSVQDLTADVAWTTDDPTVAQIGNSHDNEGFATALSVGSTVVRATFEDVVPVVGTAALAVTASCGSGNPDSVAVVPNPSTVSVGDSIQLQLIATYGTCDQNVTNNSGTNWKSNDPNVASVTKKGGEVIGLEIGTAEIEAKFKGETALADVEVISTQVARVRITAAPHVNRSTGTFTLQCVMQEIVGGVLQPEVVVTPLVAWTIDEPAVLLLGALLGNDQVFNAVAVGSAVIGCHYGGKRAQVSVTIQ